MLNDSNILPVKEITVLCWKLISEFVGGSRLIYMPGFHNCTLFSFTVTLYVVTTETVMYRAPHRFRVISPCKKKNLMNKY